MHVKIQDSEVCRKAETKEQSLHVIMGETYSEVLRFLLPWVTDNFKSSTGSARGKFPFRFHSFLFLFLLIVQRSQAGKEQDRKN